MMTHPTAKPMRTISPKAKATQPKRVNPVSLAAIADRVPKATATANAVVVVADATAAVDVIASLWMAINSRPSIQTAILS